VDRMYDASAPSEMMSIACCTGPESVYVNKTYLFGVHVNSEEYPVEYIRAARAQGARKIALLWHTGSGFTVSTCDSARATAEREGMTVVYTKSYDLAQTTQVEYDAMVAHPPLRLPPARAYAAPRARTRMGELRSRARLPACTALHPHAGIASGRSDGARGARRDDRLHARHGLAGPRQGARQKQGPQGAKRPSTLPRPHVLMGPSVDAGVGP